MLFTAITLILMMSIVRGYGSFNPDGFLDSFWYIDDYVMSKYFLMRFLNNIEANYFFFHAVNSIEMVLLDTDKITFGSTFFKVFFLPLPRELFPWKPDSMIHLYTTAYSPIARARGGSYPINIVAELIWNFWFFASIGGVFLTWLVTKLDLALIRVSQQKQGLALIFYLFVFLNAIVFARGGGAGTFVFEILAALGFILIAKVLNFLLLSSRFSSRDVQVVKNEPWRDKKA